MLLCYFFQECILNIFFLCLISMIRLEIIAFCQVAVMIFRDRYIMYMYIHF